MCGIVGYVGRERAICVIVEGLSKLEYRGYDSAGIALVGEDQQLKIFKKQGHLQALTDTLDFGVKANIGIGHTRWATHGAPSDENAHPHTDCHGHITVVHNGILENYVSLKQQLLEEGHIFSSETDTEVIAHLVEKYFTDDLVAAVRLALQEMKGSFSIVAMSNKNPDVLVAAKKDSPLIIGLGENENYIASDIPAILNRTKEVYILEDYDFAVVTKDQVKILDWRTQQPVEREKFQVTWDPITAEKSGYAHFMLKEIHEQPVALRETMRGCIRDGMVDLTDLGLDEVFQNIQKIYIVACGTAYHAGLVGRMAIEKLVRIPVEADIASEFRYRDVIWEPNSLMIIISQSGETADTMAALREAKRNNIKVLAITNVVGSAAAREADRVIYTHAGPEIAVASTKAYSTQLLVLYMLALDLARVRGVLEESELQRYSQELVQIDRLADIVLEQEQDVRNLAYHHQHVDSTFFLGRGFDYAVAMEGALKLKEISYIHAEAYAAGELKHGPLALIKQGVPVMVLMTQEDLLEKTLSNVKEVKARGGMIIAIYTENLAANVNESDYDERIVLPAVDPFIAPIIAVIPLQLFAYYMAVDRGLDVDKPRNLAKSVTVE